MTAQMKIVAIGAIAISAISVGAVPLKSSEKTTKAASDTSKRTLGSSVTRGDWCWHQEITAPEGADGMLACAGVACQKNDFNSVANDQGEIVGGLATQVGDEKTCYVTKGSDYTSAIQAVWKCAFDICDQYNRQQYNCVGAVATFKQTGAPAWEQVTEAKVVFFGPNFYPADKESDDGWKKWTSGCEDNCAFENAQCKGDSHARDYEKVTYFMKNE